MNIKILGSDKFSIIAIKGAMEFINKNQIEVWTKENC